MTEPIMVTAPAGGDRSRVKKLMIVGAVIFLLVVVGPKVLGGGGGSTPTDESFAPPAGSAAATATAKPATTGASSVRAPSTRNPFHALVALAGPSGGDAAAASTAGTAQPVPSLLPSGVVTTIDTFPFPGLTAAPAPQQAPRATSPTPDAAPSAPTPPFPSPGPRVVRRFTLVSVYIDGTGLPGARVRVDDAVIEVAEGQTFFVSYRALSLNPESKCGVFLFGDQRFSLCEGEVTQT